MMWKNPESGPVHMCYRRSGRGRHARRDPEGASPKIGSFGP